MSTVERVVEALPPEYDEGIYRSLHPDLQHMSGDRLRGHYERHGRSEGRRCHALVDRTAFAALVPPDADALEIGPFHNPSLRGERVRYFDVLDRAGLIAHGTRLGLPLDRIPEIDFVSSHGDLGTIDQTFDVVLSSHAIEHQPDLIAHLRNVSRLLRPGGLYFLMVPDKDYCFDHFNAESTIAQILDAHHARRTTHTLRSKIEHAAFTTHNESKRHWRGDHGAPPDIVGQTRAAIASHLADPDAYVDVHAWYFTPQVFRDALAVLRELGDVSFEVARLYPTLRNANEFWAILRREL